MNEIKRKITIFKFQLDGNWRGILFFIGLLGLIYTSSFWVCFIWIRSSIMVIGSIGSSYTKARYTGYLILYSVKVVLYIAIFVICIYILIRVRSSRYLEPELQDGRRLLGFDLPKTYALFVFGISLLISLYLVSDLTFDIIEFVFSIQYFLDSIIIFTFDSALAILGQLHLVVSKLIMCIFCFIGIKVSIGTSRKTI